MLDFQGSVRVCVNSDNSSGENCNTYNTSGIDMSVSLSPPSGNSNRYYIYPGNTYYIYPIEEASRSTLTNTSEQVVHALNNTATQFAAQPSAVAASGLPIAAMVGFVPGYP